MPAEVRDVTTSADQHATDAPGHAGAVAHHETGDHGHDDQAHGEEPIGPIDIAAWGAGALGLLVAIVIAACFVLAAPG
jgi:hypothetical protein